MKSKLFFVFIKAIASLALMGIFTICTADLAQGETIIRREPTTDCKVKIIPRNDYKTTIGFFNRGVVRVWKDIVKEGGTVILLEVWPHANDGMNWKRGDLWEARIYYRTKD